MNNRHAPSTGSDMAELTRQFLDSLSPDLAAALRAAAVPHWFDGEVLSVILDASPDTAAEWYSTLQQMPLVQFWGEDQHAVHELVRHQILADLWQAQSDLYRAWSRRAADYFAALAKSNQSDRARVESIYHRLLADPEHGADEVWHWGAEWNNRFQYPLVYGLVQAGLEHDQSERLSGRARGWTHYLRGLLHIHYSENLAARAALEIARQEAKEDPQLLANCIKSLGDVHLRLAEYAEARARYEEARPIYADIGDRLGEANCIKSLGDVHLALDDEEGALSAYQEAFNRFQALGLPNDAANAITAQASIYDRRKAYAQSLELYTQAIELAPDNPMWYRNRASAYINLKDVDRAAADLATAARLQPDHPYLALRRGDLALLQEEYDQAATYYQAFITSQPQSNAGHFGLARSLFGQHQRDAALAALDQALALTYAPQEVRDAIDELSEMQSTDPSLPGLDVALERLHAWLAEHG